MAGLNSSDGLAGFEYDPRNLRLSWPRPFPNEPNHTRTPQHQNQIQNPNTIPQNTNHATRLSASPRSGTGGIYEHTLGTSQGLPSALHTNTQTYNGHPMNPLQGYRPRSHGHYQTFGQSIGTHLQDPAQNLGLYQHQDSFQHHAHAGMGDVHAATWPLDQPAQTQEQYPMSSPYAQDFSSDTLNIPFPASMEDFVQPQQAYHDTTLTDAYSPLDQVDNMLSLQAFSNELTTYTDNSSLVDVNCQHHPNSPTGSSLEAGSYSSSDNGWQIVDARGSIPDATTTSVFNPDVALHYRTFSDSSYSDVEQQRVHLSWDHVPQHPIGSPDSDSAGEYYLSAGRSSHPQSSPSIKQESKPTSPVLPKLSTKPIPIKPSTSPQRSPISPTRNSPSGRKQQRKNSNKSTKATIRKLTQPSKGDAEKKIGRRKGPLRPEQRKQASEIRKLGACLRCRFLKKTCDAGEPCHGCCPSHQRQWQVPCTRMDIKDLAFFMADWNTHFHQHVGVGFTIANIAGHGSGEQTLYVTHGYGGHLLPIRAREVLVREKDCFGLDWVEEFQNMNVEHSVETARLSSGKDGISTTVLSQYLDKHIDIGFEQFVDEFFEGTPFLTEMLKTAHRFWTREKTPVVRKALKMLLAYNLIYHITLVEGIPQEENFPGKIEDTDSKFCGKTMAPGMINFEVKVAMAAMWRELQKEVLEDLSQLYRGVYSKDKLMNWPIIFMVITILLSVWEELQFDYNYRYPERTLVDSFCNEMEGIPVKVIIGLFSAMSQRFPTFQEWDTRKHHHAFNSNGAVCDALTEVRQHVTRHDQYLRNRQKTAFNRSDFDSLSSKFTSQLVIRSVA